MKTLGQQCYLREITIKIPQGEGEQLLHLYYLRIYWQTPINLDWLDKIIEDAVRAQFANYQIQTSGVQIIMTDHDRDNIWNSIFTKQHVPSQFVVHGTVEVINDETLITTFPLHDINLCLRSETIQNLDTILLQEPLTRFVIFEEEYNKNKIAEDTILQINRLPFLV